MDGLLTRELEKNENNVDIAGGTYYSPLVAACWGAQADVVEIFLQLGADPNVDASHRSG